MKNLLVISNIILLITTLILSYILLFVGTDSVKVPDESRIMVQYPPDLHDLVLSEMRDYLEVIHEINQGMAENNPQKIIEAATRQGKASLSDTPARLLKLSPLPCKKMGFKGHDLFQEIADSAGINYKQSTTVMQLARLTNNCVTCHRTYKLGR